jgi:SNF2 family DNA or RNA helicase
MFEQGARGSGHVSLLNIITELKKTCNHPFLFESAEESYRGRDDENAVDRLVTTSGKVEAPRVLFRRDKRPCVYTFISTLSERSVYNDFGVPNNVFSSPLSLFRWSFWTS